jgi:hypothetical protein
MNLEDVPVRFNEDELFDDINKKKFYNWLNKNGYTKEKLQVLFDRTKIDGMEQNKFNNTLIRASLETDITISEMVLFFEDDLIKMKNILFVLDKTVKNKIKEELSHKYSIKIEKNNSYQLWS